MEAFGIDTSDPVKFPRRSNGKVNGFNNLWIVELKPVWMGDHFASQGRLLPHLLLNFGLGVSDTQRDYGLQPSPWAEAREE